MELIRGSPDYSSTYLHDLCGEVVGVSRELPEKLAIELVLKWAVLEASVHDVLYGVNVEGEVRPGQFGGHKVPGALKQLLGCHVEGCGGEGGEGTL